MSDEDEPTEPAKPLLEGKDAGRNFSTGLFSCQADIGSSVLTVFCPCVTAMNIAPEVDQSSVMCFAMNCPWYFIPACFWVSALGGCMLRQSFRASRDIDSGKNCIIQDLCMGGGPLCWWCSLCQMSRELTMGGVSGVQRMHR